MSVRRTRNDISFWYCLLDPTVEHAVLDENGNETGEIIPHYQDAVQMWANVSPATGIAQTELFGNLDNYDKVIVTTDMNCPVNEQSVLFLDSEPSYSTVTTHEIVAGDPLQNTDDSIEPVTYSVPKYDYIVRRVARGLNAISFAVRKVEIV